MALNNTQMGSPTQRLNDSTTGPHPACGAARNHYAIIRFHHTQCPPIPNPHHSRGNCAFHGIQDAAIPSPKAVIHLRSFNLFEHSPVFILCILNRDPDRNRQGVGTGNPKFEIGKTQSRADDCQLTTFRPTQQHYVRKSNSAITPLHYFTITLLDSTQQRNLAQPLHQKPYHHSAKSKTNLKCSVIL